MVQPGAAQPVRERLADGGPGTRLRDEDRAPSRQAFERIDDGVARDPFAEHEPPDRRLRMEERRAGGCDRRRQPLEAAVERLDDAVHLGHPRASDGRRGIEALALATEVPDGPDRVASGDERTDVGRAAQALGEDLRPSVEPDRGATPVERPAVARVDDRAAAGRHDAADGRVSISVAQVGHGIPLERRKAASPSSAKISGIDRPAADSIRSSRSMKRRAVALGQPPPDDALAAAGQPDQHDVHRGSQSSPPEPASSVPVRPVGLRGVRRRSRWHPGPGRSRRRPPATGASGGRDPRPVGGQVRPDVVERVAAELLRDERRPA